MDTDELQSCLETSGWWTTDTTAASEQTLAQQIHKLAWHLGEIVPGRNRQPIERVVPHAPDAAYAGSLSSEYGLNALPLHTDTAHWPVPCRYLVMGCIEPGPRPVPTMLLDSRKVQLSQNEISLCRNTPFLVRNGRRSFYGSILDADRTFIRFDRGCMTPLSQRGHTALDVFSDQRHAGILHSHNWRAGQIIVFDNWRVLHGRGGEQTKPGRILLRAMIR
jgi:hypothetical protein